MVSVFFRLAEIKYNRLKELPGSLAEHLRKAVDDYLLKQDNTASSASEMKGGSQNG